MSIASYSVCQRPPRAPYCGSSSYTLADAPANESESPASRTADLHAAPRHTIAAIALNLRQPPIRQDRQQRRQPAPAEHDVEFAPARRQRGSELPELGQPRLRAPTCGGAPYGTSGTPTWLSGCANNVTVVSARDETADGEIDDALDSAVQRRRNRNDTDRR